MITCDESRKICSEAEALRCVHSNNLCELIYGNRFMLTFSDFKMMMNEIDYEIDWLSSKLKSIDVQKVLYRMGFPENYKQISYIE